jgi:hypothetical protein
MMTSIQYLLKASAVAACLFSSTLAINAKTVVFSEDFSDPKVRTDFPYLGGTGDSAYTVGEWVAFKKDAFGSVIENGVATVNQGAKGQWAIAIVLDMKEHGPGKYKVTFDVDKNPAGVFSVAEIENLGSVRILTNKVSSEAFNVGQSRARVANLLAADGKGWQSVYDATWGKKATFTFTYDGTGFLGFALSAFNRTATIDNFQVIKVSD